MHNVRKLFVLTKDWCFVGRGEPTPYRHQEHSHVEHGGDAQGDLLTRFSWDKEDTSCNQELLRIDKYLKVLQSQNIDENSRLNVIKQEELWFSPDKKVVPRMKYTTILPDYEIQSNYVTSANLSSQHGSCFSCRFA